MLLVFFPKILRRALYLLHGMRRWKKLKYKHQLLQKDSIETFGHVSVSQYQVEEILVTCI